MASDIERIRINLPSGIPGLVAVATREATITSVSQSENSKSKTVRLIRGTKPGDGEKMAIVLVDQHGGAGPAC